jgi:ABC-2 type transport system permease protein
VLLYVEVAVRSFRRQLAYRAAALAGLFTNSVFGGVISAVYLAFYREVNAGEQVAGYALDQVLTYVWVAQSLISVIAIWGWWDIALAIRSGDVVADLMKPFDYYLYWLSRDLGRAGSQVLLRGAPTFVVGALFFDLALPASPGRWLAFAASVPLAVLVSFGLRFLVNVSAFWLIDVIGTRAFVYAIVNFFSGQYIPLVFFPDWLRLLADLLPFRAMVMSPVEALLGTRDPALVLGQQALWVAVLTLACYAVLGRAIRRVVVQGG